MCVKLGCGPVVEMLAQRWTESSLLHIAMSAQCWAETRLLNVEMSAQRRAESRILPQWTPIHWQALALQYGVVRNGEMRSYRHWPAGHVTGPEPSATQSTIYGSVPFILQRHINVSSTWTYDTLTEWLNCHSQQMTSSWYRSYCIVK